MYDCPESILDAISERKKSIRYKDGINIKNSDVLIIDQSVRPPKYPESPPARAASKSEMAVATKPIVRDTREP
jgi:hypothetical protein